MACWLLFRRGMTDYKGLLIGIRSVAILSIVGACHVGEVGEPSSRDTDDGNMEEPNSEDTNDGNMAEPTPGGTGNTPSAAPCKLPRMGGTFEAVRLNGSFPVMTSQHFKDVEAPRDHGGNIAGPSVVLTPEWARINADDVYRMYFADHKGSHIRLAYAAVITGPWTLFNEGRLSSPTVPGAGVLDLDLGPGGTIVNDNRVSLGRWDRSGHCASPDVFVDHENERFVMYFHCDGPHDTFVATSATGLNFNQPNEGGEPGHGIRDQVLAGPYTRAFMLDNQMFALGNRSALFKSPRANVDITDDAVWLSDNPEEYAWAEIVENSPLRRMYNNANLNDRAPRHVAVLHNACEDPNSLFIFWSDREEQIEPSRREPDERIYMTLIDLTGLSVEDRLDPSKWTLVGQKVILKPQEKWEGEEVIRNGNRSYIDLRDPAIFQDTDGRIYLFYSGGLESAIGVAELIHSEQSNTLGEQGPALPGRVLPGRM